ncbi:hypothetical protein EII42_07855 [Tessaracoccus sp. OH4464_COT-324]|nr:hypothetical protein EII42_07855 [Tessaracoccus sp. OH4464_COT-324]
MAATLQSRLGVLGQDVGDRFWLRWGRTSGAVVGAEAVPEPEVFTSHRVRVLGWPIAHAVKAQGASRRCAHRWIAGYDLQGETGLYGRSSRPHHSPRRTAPAVELRSAW